MIAIIDYRAGNLASVKKALDRVGAESVITSDPELVARAQKIVLPGVGHFAATAALDAGSLKAAIAEQISKGVPFLGICLGMQWLFTASEEAPGSPGLGWFGGRCQKFPAAVKSPHVGWNDLRVCGASRLLRGVPAHPFVYFTHSYRAPVVEDTVAECEYGGRFSAVVERDQVFGVQFHPEKSGEPGLKMLANFCAL